jgi:SagB-type dehydrogenase family enzyme
MLDPRVEGQARIILPTAETRGVMSAAEALFRRRSHREFAPARLSIGQVSQLCWAAQGITDPAEGLRTVPSAGALFPITVFVIDHNGLYRYEPKSHRLDRVLAGDIRAELQAAALDQECVGSAPLCLVIAIDIARSAVKYGQRAERYCLLEAGHAAQNVLLQATTIGLVGVPVGAFHDQEVCTVLNLPQELDPVYLLPLGARRGS